MPSRAAKNSRTLILPDVHQNISWVRQIISRENRANQIVFLGDYFDSNQSHVASVEETCAFIAELDETLGEAVTFLLGNHDIQYLEAKTLSVHHKTPRLPKYECGPSYSSATAKKVAKHLPDTIWGKAKLFTVIDGWLLSHAGVAATHWPKAASTSESLRKLDAQCTAALADLAGRKSDPLLEGGPCRGGEAPIGGITWLDWDQEFDDDATPLPQIVGHTRSSEGARQRGRSWCLDGSQTTYGILERGLLQIASIGGRTI